MFLCHVGKNQARSFNDNKFVIDMATKRVYAIDSINPLKLSPIKQTKVSAIIDGHEVSKFDILTEVTTANEQEILIEFEPVKYFVNHEVVPADDACMPLSDIHKSYVEFCRSWNIKPITAKSLGVILREKYKPQGTTRSAKYRIATKWSRLLSEPDEEEEKPKKTQPAPRKKTILPDATPVTVDHDDSCVDSDTAIANAINANNYVLTLLNKTMSDMVAVTQDAKKNPELSNNSESINRILSDTADIKTSITRVQTTLRDVSKTLIAVKDVVEGKTADTSIVANLQRVNDRTLTLASKVSELTIAVKSLSDQRAKDLIWESDEFLCKLTNMVAEKVISLL